MKILFTTIIILGLAVLATAREARPIMSRALLHNTVRIESIKTNGTHVGTGFFYTFKGVRTNASIPVIVTCRHLIADSTRGRLHFALGGTNALTRLQDHFTAELPDFSRCWIGHPDTNIDLAVLPLAPIMRMLEEQGKRLDVAPVGANIIPTEADLPKYGVFQEVKIIGYPVGIWDEKNNLPIIRRGMTATDPSVDYNGRTEFLVDAAVFPGSSGSPVYIANESLGPVAGSPIQYSWIRFLGVLYAVHQYTSDGQVEIIKIPTAFDFKAKTQIPANLGLVIKASRLNDFLAVIDAIENGGRPQAKSPGDEGSAGKGRGLKK